MFNFLYGAQPSLLRSWIVFIASTLFFFYIYILLNTGGAINGELEREFGFNAEQISRLFAICTFGNTIFLFPAGLLIDRFSARYLLVLMFAITVGATYIFSLAHGFAIMEIMRFVTGLAGAFSFITALKIAAQWFEARHLALASGVLLSMGMLGGIVSQTPLTLLTGEFGWRLTLKVVVGLGVVLLILQFLLVRDAPRRLEHVEEVAHEKLEKMGFLHSLWVIVKNKQNWLCGLYVAFINLPLFVLGSTWGVPYLTQIHNFTKVDASEINSMVFVGMLIGSPLAGMISDRLQLRKLPMIIGAVFSIIAIAAIIYMPHISFCGGIVLYLMLGMMVSTQGIAYPMIAESNPLTVTATAASLASIFVLASGSLVQVYGWLLELAGDAITIDGIKVFTHDSFLHANWLIFGSIVLSLIAALFMRETHGKSL